MNQEFQCTLRVIFENFLKLKEPLGECNLKKIKHLEYSVSPKLLELSYVRLSIYVTEKITNVRA